MKQLLAQDAIPSIFGQVSPPPGSPAGDAPTALAKFLGVGIQIIIIIAVLLVFIYLLLGALDWLTSAGEKEKIAKAQNKIIAALIGIFFLIGSFVLFRVVTDTVLGGRFVRWEGGKPVLVIPTIP